MKHAEIIHQWVDGAELECRSVEGTGWGNPILNFNPVTRPDLEWRVKPKVPMINGVELPNPVKLGAGFIRLSLYGEEAQYFHYKTDTDAKTVYDAILKAIAP